MSGNNLKYEVEIAVEVLEKDLPKLSSKLSNIIKRKLLKLEENPFIGKPLQGILSNCYSLKVSKYRVVYKVFKSRLLVLVIAIGKRDNSFIYKLAEKRLH